MSEKAGTLVFIPKFKIKISKKKIFLQIDKVALEAQEIIKQDYRHISSNIIVTQDSNEEGDNNNNTY